MIAFSQTARGAPFLLAASVLVGAGQAGSHASGLPILSSPMQATELASTGNEVPVTGKLNQGFVIRQVAPPGEAAGPIFFNSISSAFASKVTGVSEPGRPGCACVAAFHASLGVGGKNLEATELYGASFGISQRTGDDNSTADKVGIGAGAYSNKRSPGKLYGASTSATLDNGGATPQMVGLEVDSIIRPGGSVPYRIGLNVWNGGESSGSVLDTAFAVSNSGNKGSRESGWKKLFSLYTRGGALNPALTKDADFFYADKAATVANVFNLPNVKVTGDILKFPSTTLTGSGDLKVASVKAYAAPVSAGMGEVAYGGATAPPSKCGSLPGSTGCVIINVAGKQHYMPYW